MDYSNEEYLATLEDKSIEDALVEDNTSIKKEEIVENTTVDRPGITNQTLANRFLRIEGIETWLAEYEVSSQLAWPVPGSNGKTLYLHFADPEQTPQARALLGHTTKQGTTQRKIDKRLRVIFSEGALQLVSYGVGEVYEDTVAVYRLPGLRNATLRMRAESSPLSVNDGHGVISRRAALAFVQSSIMQQHPDWDYARAQAEATRRMRDAHWLQHFSLSSTGGTKGLLKIIDNEVFDTRYGTTHNVVIDRENVKGDVQLSTDVALIKAYLRRPLDKDQGVPIAELAEIGVGHDVRVTIGSAEAYRVAKELTTKAAYELAADLEADTQRLSFEEAAVRLPWQTIETSAYSMPDEKQLTQAWVGSLYVRTKGRLPSTLGTTKDRGAIVRTQALLSALTAYFAGDGSYYDEPCPEHGYINPVYDGRKVIAWTMAPSTLSEASLQLDTMDADGDFVAVGLRTKPGDPHPFWAQVTRMPTSVGGGALLKLTEENFKFLQDDRGLIPSPIVAADPYAHFQTEGMYTLQPIPDTVGEAPIGAGKWPAVGALYNLSNVMKILGIIDRPVSAGYRLKMLKHGVVIPQVDGLRFNLSEHAIDPAGTKDLMVEELERVLWEYLADGGKIDQCWYSRTFLSVERLMQQNKVGASVNFFYAPCSGEHLRYNNAVDGVQTAARRFEKDLDMMANGPLSALMEPIEPKLTALVLQMHRNVASVWAEKFRACDSIPGNLPWKDRQAMEMEAFHQAQVQLAELLENTYNTAREGGLLQYAGMFANAVVQGAALDERRFGTARRATQVNHLYTWARYSEIGKSELQYFSATHPSGVPTSLIRLDQIAETLQPGTVCTVQANSEGFLFLLDSDGNTLADVLQGGLEAQGRQLIYRGLTADNRSDIFEVTTLLKGRTS